MGWITLTQSGDALVRVDWSAPGPAPGTDLMRDAARQIAAYFDGDLTTFDLALAPLGDAFQQSVCREMLAIPFGETRTYGAIAERLSAPPQAVGQGCGNNSIPIIIPCHRVVGATGLGGFSARGGVETKVALLRHEGAYSLLI